MTKQQWQWIALGSLVALVLVIVFSYRGSNEALQGKVGLDGKNYKSREFVGASGYELIAGTCLIFCDNGNSGGYTKSCDDVSQTEATNSCKD
jgi:hypothetical protein